VTFGAPFFSPRELCEAEGVGVSLGLGRGLSSGVAVGVGDAFLRFDFVFGVAVGVGVGERFLRLDEGVGDGVGVVFFAECFRCLLGAGVGLVKIFLIFVPNESSAAAEKSIAPKSSVTIKSNFVSTLVLKQVAGESEIQNSTLKRNEGARPE